MKAPGLQRTAYLLGEGQTGKAQDCENTEARGHHQPAPTITSALYNFRKTYQIYTLCPFPRLLQGQIHKYNQHLQVRPDVAAWLWFKQNAKRKATAAAPCVPGYLFITEMPWLWCYQSCIDQIWLFLDEHMFLFYREEASKVDDDKNLCFLLCFKALTDIINWNWRQN